MATAVPLKEKRKRRLPAKLLPEDEPESPKVTKFYVVEFPVEKKTSIVPENWLELYEGQHFCYWPPDLVRSALREAIRNGDTPDPDKWSSYPVKIHFNGSHEKCAKMEHGLTLPSTSGESSDEQLTSKSAKRKKSRPLNPDNAESEEILEGGIADAVIPDVNMADGGQLVEHCEMCTCSINCRHCKAKDKANKKFQRTVLESLAKLRNELQASVEARKIGVKPFRINGIQIPLQSLDDLKKLDALLTNPVVIQELKAALKSYVDVKLYNTALAMMKSMFTIRLKKKLNWEGKNRGKTGLAKEFPKLAAAILDGAKEAVGDRWSLTEIKNKLMRILVKAKRMDDNGTDEPVPEVNAAGNNIEGGTLPPINVDNQYLNHDV